jgi:hypothetical protein
MDLSERPVVIIKFHIIEVSFNVIISDVLQEGYPWRFRPVTMMLYLNVADVLNFRDSSLSLCSVYSNLILPR